MNNNDDEELEQDVLKLQIHSIPLNLNWDKVEEEYDDESDEGEWTNYCDVLFNVGSVLSRLENQLWKQ